ncbi:hypothetical protein [Pedobacter sp.]|jgi:hypothetical protein|uniref:hypothetical protein n=1 Tax=Pedobacter sp. TaxID=1411316 RepID=UPI002BDB3B61|nr:hypothetical protein [Pedobacter sp.]HWW40343.1 hypothetical protein [Pedobacter sp.]
MKKANFLFWLLFFLLLSTNMFAQPKPGADYFKGKWSVLIKGTPSGDTRMIFLLENRNDSITGVVQDTTGAEISKISKVELTDTSAAVYFTAQGYDVSLVMNKKDNDHITGSLMSMFDAEGERVKKTQ